MELISSLFRYLQVKYDNSPESTPRPLNQLRQEYCFGKSIFCSSITAGSLHGGGGWTDGRVFFCPKRLKCFHCQVLLENGRLVKWSEVRWQLHMFCTKCSDLSPALATVSLYRIIQSFLEVSPCHLSPRSGSHSVDWALPMCWRYKHMASRLLGSRSFAIFCMLLLNAKYAVCIGSYTKVLAKLCFARRKLWLCFPESIYLLLGNGFAKVTRHEVHLRASRLKQSIQQVILNSCVQTTCQVYRKT